ncbi:MAG: glycosyltransferase family 4 protein [Bacteroidetes bacterium]|nr:glycosyltransferase family 4 protein [Bacteroidota bacterium]
MSKFITLVKRGYNVEVVSPKYELNFFSKEENGVKYTFLDCSYNLTSFVKSKFKVKRWDYVAYDYFLQNKPDLIISQSSAGYPIIKQKKEHKIPVLSIAHGSILREFRTLIKKFEFKHTLKFLINSQFVLKEYLFRQRNFIRMSNAVVAVSEDAKKDVSKETGRKDIQVIYVGVDSTRYLLPNINNNDQLKLIYVGVIIREKGLGFILESLVELNKLYPSVKLTVVGDGEDLLYFRELSKELGVSANVTFLGRVLYNNIPKILNAHNLFLLPTIRDEGFPMVILEALTAGLPIVATDKGGTKNVVKSGINGMLLDPTSNIKNDLTEAIKFIKDGNKLESMSQESIRLSKEFSMAKSLDKYEKIIQNLLKS